MHTLIHSDDLEATRTFLRDVLGLPYVDAHEGWLIFRTGPSELGVHPASPPGTSSGPAGTHHEISLMCDDLATTVAELATKGAEFAGPPQEQRWGLSVSMLVPGAGEMLLYQPRHPTAYGL